MQRFKTIVLFVHAASILLCSLSPFWGIGALCISFVFLLLYFNQFFMPLEKMIAGNFPLPIEKNAFTPVAISMNEMHEKIKEGKLQSQGKEKDLENILDTLNEGVVAFNMRSKVTFVNTKACQLLNHSKQELLGRSFLYFGDLLQKCHEIVLYALQTAESINEKWNLDGTYYDLVAAPLMHQEGAILVIQDKTSDCKILEVGKNFIANASHEVRTPITVIRGFAEMLQNMSVSPKEMEEITGKIVHTCDRLDKLVKSLLTISDLENFSADRFRECHVGSLIENCKHLLACAYPNAKLHVAPISENLSIHGDFDLLGSALMNVLENAAKYSESPILLKVQQLRGMIHILVEDQGIGIPKLDLPHIFDRFYTVDKARSRKSGGVGLGLSIVKLILEKHRGSVSVQSEHGKGSTFTLSIPI